MIKEITISTNERYQLIDIIAEVAKIVKESQVKNGTVLVFVPHSTAAILLTENEKGLKEDILNVLKKMVSGFDFKHNQIDDNADAHILSALIGQERFLIIKDSQLLKGIWQNIFLVELDGPRERHIFIEILKSPL